MFQPPYLVLEKSSLDRYDCIFQLFCGLIAHCALLANLCQNIRIGIQMCAQLALEVHNILNLDIIEHIIGNGINDCNLIFYCNRRGAVLLEHLHDAFALRQTALGVLIEVGTELCE